MERVKTILEKLQTQLSEGATPTQMLLSAQMLQHELIILKDNSPQDKTSLVEISMPLNTPTVVIPEPIPEIIVQPTPIIEEPEEKIVQVLEIDEAEIEAELEEIKKNAAAIQKLSAHGKPQLLFESMDDDIPTLHLHGVPTPATPQKEINELVSEKSNSFNDTLKETKTEISETLTDTPIKDLKKAIGVNDRYLYINELFRGDEAMYERSIKTINSFTIWPEAEYWIRRELKTKLGWDDQNMVVKQFDQLVKRRFS